MKENAKPPLIEMEKVIMEPDGQQRPSFEGNIEDSISESNRMNRSDRINKRNSKKQDSIYTFPNVLENRNLNCKKNTVWAAGFTFLSTLKNRRLLLNKWFLTLYKHKALVYQIFLW